MTKYIAFLRGINVGGNKIMKMAQLRLLFESIGLSHVKTYIQSGNVLFQSNDEEEVLRNLIEHKIEDVFGFKVTVILRTATALEQIIKNCPFSEETIVQAQVQSGGQSLYVSFFLKVPPQEKIKLLDNYINEYEEYKIQDQEGYLLVRKNFQNSKLANNLHKLDVPATVRNWKTIHKLAMLIKTE